MIENTLHVLYITTFYPTKDRPHHGIFFQDHAEALAQKHKVSVLHVGVQSLKERFVTKQRSEIYQKNRVLTVHELGWVLTHRNEKSIREELTSCLFKGYNAIKEYYGKPDFVIAQCSLPAGELALQLKERENINYGIIEHFSFLQQQIQEQTKTMENVYRNSSWVSSVNHNLSNLISSTFKIKTYKIDNVVSSLFRYTKNIKSNPFKWLFVGYNHPKKGTDLLTEILEMRPDLHITLVGEGLDRCVPKNAKYVTLIKSATRKEMVELMHSHHALLSTSRIETFGMAIVEALASGLPVVATKSGGPEQYIDAHSGILCDFDVNKLLSAIDFIQNKSENYDSEKISSSIMHKFGAENYIRQIEFLIKDSSK